MIHEHHRLTLADLDELIGKLTLTRDTIRLLAGQASPPLSPATETSTQAPRTAVASARKPTRKQTAADDPPARPLRRAGGGQTSGGSVGAALRVVIPQFGGQWFTNAQVREKIVALGTVPEDKLSNACVQLIGYVSRGRLESRGTGRAREFRAPASFAETYEDRKKQLLS